MFLSGLTNLRKLDLYDTKVTDAALNHLFALKALRYLNLPDVVSTKGVLFLSGELPECDVVSILLP